MVPFHWLNEAPPFMDTLRALDTFNHDRCDAFLTAHGIDVMIGVFSAGNRPPFRNVAYIDLWILIAFEIGFAAVAWIVLILKGIPAVAKGILCGAFLLPL